MADSTGALSSEEECAYDPHGAEQCQELLNRLYTRGLNSLIKDRRKFLWSNKKCFVASEFVLWLQAIGEARSDAEAVRIGQRFLEYDLIHHISDDHPFKNEKLYFRFRTDEDNVEKGPSVASVKLACGVTKSGVVFVKRFLFWSPRYMVCKADEEKLFVYNSDLDSYPREIIDLSKMICNVKESTACKEGFYCFQLEGARNFTMAVEKSKDQEGWMQALTNAGAKFQEENMGTTAKSIWEFTANDLDGNPVPLSNYQGKVCLIVNVASK